MWLAKTAFPKITTASLVALLVAGVGPFYTSTTVQAMALFAGVSDIQLSENPTGQVLLRFKADLPFQYQLQVLDENRVVITLLNARLASQLKEAEGHVHLQSTFPLDQSLYEELSALQSGGPQEEIILKAPGLGQREIQVEGATRVASSPISLQPDISFEEEGLEVAPRLQKRIATAKTEKPPITVHRAPKLALQEPDTTLNPAMAIATPYTTHRSSKASGNNSSTLAYTLSGSKETHTLPVAPARVLTLNAGRASEETQQSHGFNALSLVEEKPHPLKVQTVGVLMQDALNLYRQNKLQQAAETIQQALTIEPGNGALYAALGEIYLKDGRLTNARETYQQAIQLSNNPRYQYRYAVVILRDGDRQVAMQVLENLLKPNPTHAPAHYLLGTLYQELGQTALAISHLQRAEQLNPQSADIHYTLGLAYELDGNRDLAKTHYTKAIQLNPIAHEAAQALERIKS